MMMLRTMLHHCGPPAPPFGVEHVNDDEHELETMVIMKKMRTRCNLMAAEQ